MRFPHTFIGLMWLLLLVSMETRAQSALPDTVCNNNSDRAYFVSGSPGSTYSWTVPGGTIIGPNNMNTIHVNWNGVSPGNYSITVVEHAVNGCSGDPLTGNVRVTQVPYISFQECFDTVTTTNAQPVKLKSGIPAGGTYSGTGVSNGYFYPAIAGAGIHQVSYTRTNGGCSSVAHLNITVLAAVPFTCGQNFTDVRDGTIYPTIEIGSQCWMNSNLRYGTAIPSDQHQRDNCINEKYLYSSSILQPPSSFYQWDELMNYEATPANQGLCPPGWHVPLQSEWNTLMNLFAGNAYAGDSLKPGGISGFNALSTGAGFNNSKWDLAFATFFWTSDAHGTTEAWAHGLNTINHGVSLYPSSRSNAFPVRCIKD